MVTVKGFLNEIDVNEFSSQHTLDNTIRGQMRHVAYVCAKCEEVNVIFEFKTSPLIHSCDKCKTKFSVIFDNQIIVSSKELNELVESKVVEA